MFLVMLYKSGHNKKRAKDHPIVVTLFSNLKFLLLSYNLPSQYPPLDNKMRLTPTVRLPPQTARPLDTQFKEKSERI